MTAIKSQHSRVFEHLIGEYRRWLAESMANGTPVDYPSYRELVGQMAGLKDALRISEEADFKISGDEPDAGA